VDAHGERVHDLHVAERSEGGSPAHLVLGVHQSLEAELDRLRVHRLAVVELHAGPELELPHRGSHELRHLAGEGRLYLELGVALEQRIEDVPADVPRRRFLVIHRIEGGRVHALGDGHLALGNDGGSGRDGHGKRGHEDGGARDAGPAHGDTSSCGFPCSRDAAGGYHPGPHDGGPGLPASPT
jgi:hypothetical protein